MVSPLFGEQIVTPCNRLEVLECLSTKRSLFPGKMGNNISIVLIPYKPDPLNIFLPIEFIQLFEKESIILNTEVDTITPLHDDNGITSILNYGERNVSSLWERGEKVTC